MDIEYYEKLPDNQERSEFWGDDTQPLMGTHVGLPTAKMKNIVEKILEVIQLGLLTWKCSVLFEVTDLKKKKD